MFSVPFHSVHPLYVFSQYSFSLSEIILHTLLYDYYRYKVISQLPFYNSVVFTHAIWLEYPTLNSKDDPTGLKLSELLSPPFELVFVSKGNRSEAQDFCLWTKEFFLPLKLQSFFFFLIVRRANRIKLICGGGRARQINYRKRKSIPERIIIFQIKPNLNPCYL